MGSHEEVVQDEQVISEPREIYEGPSKKICSIISTQQIKDCVLLKLKCEDGSDDFILKCSNHAIGKITNPPRPL